MERTQLREVLRLNRVYAVAPEKLWRAWTDAEALRVWFGQSEAPGWEAELDVRVGGRYRLSLRHPRGESEGGGTELGFTQDPLFDPEARDGWRADFKRLGKFFQDTRS